MESLKLELNQRVEILWEDKVYYCNVQEEFEGKPVISLPVCNSEYLTLKEGEIIDAVYYDKNYGVYGFIMKIEGRRLENNIPCYIVSKPFNVRRIQRREYVRVCVIESIVCAITTKDDEEKFCTGILLDLSGGGLRVKMNEELDIGDKIICDYKDENTTIHLPGRVVRREKDIENNYIYGICFEDIGDRIRDKIIKNVFLVMRKQRELC